jgi:hypothetical protein
MKNIKILDTGENFPGFSRSSRYWATRIKRVNLNKYRPGIKIPRSIDLTNFSTVQKLFNIKGFEFGNWLSNQERYDFLNYAFVALYDMGKVLGFSKNLGLNKTIGIGFGSRGSGRSTGVAHFEPDNFMINLTKQRGAGSLAHEYGHALDFFFGTYIDLNMFSRSLSGGRLLGSQIHKQNYTSSLRKEMYKVMELIIFQPGSTDKTTKYYQGLPYGDYWRNCAELFARAFEQYIHFHLEKRGIRNSFLSKSKYSGKRIYMPTNHFKQVEPHIRKLINEMKKIANS